MRIPKSIRDFIPVLARALNPRLHRVLFGDAFNSSVQAKVPVTLELFLSALYKSYPQEMSGFFYRPETLSTMAQEFFPPGVNISSAVTPQQSLQPDSVLFAKLDERLVFLLWEAAQLASSSGRGPADLADFIGAMSLDDETMDRLQKERNLVLKGYLGSLSYAE
jgi:hypothetical protein